MSEEWRGGYCKVEFGVVMVFRLLDVHGGLDLSTNLESATPVVHQN